MKPWRPWYVIIANTAILICVLQVAAYGILRAYYFATSQVEEVQTEAVKRNYAHMTAAEQEDMYEGELKMRYRLDQDLGIIPGPVTSRFLNIDGHGIRSNGPTPRPLDALNGATWFLGGSTAFGDRIADHETIPAQLERIIGTPVINMGVPSYSSPLENGVFTHYLRLGYRPSRVLFLDGVNETCEPELYGREMRRLFQQAQEPYYWDAGGPLVALVTRAAGKAMRAAGFETEPGSPQAIACSHDGKTYPLIEMHTRIMAERAALCRAYAVECVTLVQPFAGTHGPSTELPRWFLDGNAHDLRAVYTHLEPSWKAAGAVFVTDALDTYQGHPFIDEMHYSADASRVIAEVIARRLNLIAQ